MVDINKSSGNALTTEIKNGCETLEWIKSKVMTSRQRTTVYLAIEKQHSKNNVHK